MTRPCSCSLRAARRFENVALSHAVDFSERHGDHFAVRKADDFNRNPLALILEPAHTAHRHVRAVRLDRVSYDLVDDAELGDGIDVLQAIMKPGKVQHGCYSSNRTRPIVSTWLATRPSR
jgi:hypothetical protein